VVVVGAHRLEGRRRAVDAAIGAQGGLEFAAGPQACPHGSGGFGQSCAQGFGSGAPARGRLVAFGERRGAHGG
jgi:hypothetical protein